MCRDSAFVYESIGSDTKPPFPTIRGVRTHHFSHNMGIISTAKSRLRAITLFTGLFGVVILVGTISLYNYLCRIDVDIDRNVTTADSGSNSCENPYLACRSKQAWVELTMLAILGGIYQVVSSMFVFKGTLGMRSWIIGNIILGVFFAFFGFYVSPLFPKLMVIFLCNAVVLMLCSLLGYTVKNMSAFEESSMSLL